MSLAVKGMLFRIHRYFSDRFIPIILGVIIIIIGGVLLFRNNPSENKNEFRLSSMFKHSTLKQVSDCEDPLLFNSLQDFQFSTMYQTKQEEFGKVVQDATRAEKGKIESHTGEYKGETQILHQVARESGIKVICETGFNFGHSSFNFLTANENATVHSFDLGNHKYATTMSDYLKKLFPTRFFIHFGDSTKTLPEFILNNPEFQCDFMFIDGGHLYEVALADIKNFARIANLEKNIMLFDDHPTKWGKDFGQAWEDAVKEGILEELFQCSFLQLKYDHGLTMGRVIKKP